MRVQSTWHVTDNETIADRNFRSRTSRDYRPSAWVPVFGSRTAFHVARSSDRFMRATFPVRVGIGFRVVTNIRADAGEGECDPEESRDWTVTIITRHTPTENSGQAPIVTFSGSECRQTLEAVAVDSETYSAAFSLKLRKGGIRESQWEA